MHCGDTSFFVDLFDPERSHHADAKAWYDEHRNRPLFAPAVVKWELYRGGARMDASYTQQLQRFTADVETLPLTEEGALEAGYRGTGIPSGRSSTSHRGLFDRRHRSGRRRDHRHPGS